MGGKPSKSEEPGLQEHERLGAIVVKEIDDPHGQDKISTMQFMRSVESQKMLNEWIQSLQRIDDSQTRQTILIPDKHFFEKGGLCGSSGNVKLLYESFPYVLESQIKNRAGLHRDFLETQMWYLLYSMVRAGTKFQKIKQKIGDVHPFNILINDDGQIKLISRCSIPGELDNFQKAIEDKKAKVFLAPQQLNNDALQKGQYPGDVDRCRAQVFSLGLTILGSGVLSTCQDVYQGYEKINENVLNQYLHNFRNKYSSYMFSILCSMLNLKPSERRSCSSIFNELRVYEDQILDLQPFKPPTANQLVHQSNFVNQGYNMVQTVQYQMQPNHQPNHQPTGYRPQTIQYSGYHR